MAVTPLADVGDVAAIWRPITDTETGQIESLIDKASARLRHKCPFDIDARIALFAITPSDPLALDPIVVADVVANIVKRFLANPDGVAVASETAGQFSQSRTFTSYHDRTPPEARGTMVILDSDIDQLRPAAPVLKPRTISVGESNVMRDPEWYLRDFGGVRPYFPYPYPLLYPSNAVDEDDLYFDEHP